MKADKSSIDAKIESMETVGSIVLAARDHKAIFDFIREYQRESNDIIESLADLAGDLWEFIERSGVGYHNEFMLRKDQEIDKAKIFCGYNLPAEK